MDVVAARRQPIPAGTGLPPPPFRSFSAACSAASSISGRPRRRVATAGRARDLRRRRAVSCISGILQGWFGVLQGDYLLNAAVFATALLAVAAPIVGIAGIIGRLASPLGLALFLLIANPISSAAAPVEFLLAPWGAVGQWFPPGAGATLIRETSYFPAADTTFPWLVLAGWAAGGILLALVGHVRATGGTNHGSEVAA